MASEEYHMKSNIKKIKVLRTQRQRKKEVKREIEDEQLELVNSFKYFGGIRTVNGKWELEIKFKIAIAREALKKKRSYW